ncbi:MAG: DUF3098 domain-containing protein [Chitinophagales bacterium]
MKKVATATVKSESKSSSPTSSLPFLFDKQHYLIMLAGVAVILVGFVLMLGTNNTDPAVFPADEIYSFRRITLAPIVVMFGFAIEIFAILKKSAE